MTLMEKVFRRTLPTFLTLALVVLGGSLRASSLSAQQPELAAAARDRAGAAGRRGSACRRRGQPRHPGSVVR